MTTKKLGYTAAEIDEAVTRVCDFVGEGTKNQDTGTAAPTTGTWPLGWIRWNTEPVAGDNIGWVCISAGTPGIWQPWGLISLDPT